MPNECPLCKHRVSDWVMAWKKATEGSDRNIYHNSCLIDYELKYGQPHPAIGRFIGERKP